MTANYLKKKRWHKYAPGWYYDLADTLYETPDKDLLAIVNYTRTGETCGH